MAYRVDYGPMERASGRRSNVMSGLGGAIGGAIKGGLDKRQGRVDEAKIAGLSEQARSGDVGAQDELARIAPEINQQIMGRIGADTEQKQKGLVFDYANTISLHQAGNQQGALDNLDRRIEVVSARGGDTTQTQQIRDMYAANPEQGAAYLGKAMQYLVDPKEFAKLATPGAEKDVQVGAQEILEDGTIIQSTPQGPVVYNALGKKVTGQAARDAVLLGRAEKVSNLREAAGQKKAATLEEELRLKGQVEANVISAKDAAKISTEAYGKLEKINLAINNMNEGIEILTDDPNMTGPVMKMLPSVRKNANKLKNLQGRMGLDVIGNTTFGALSESELKFATDTALPTGLQGPALKEWMIQRRDAQEKLADYIEAAAIFLGKPGNTVKDWIVYQKEKRTERIASGSATPEEVARGERSAARGGGTAQTVNTGDMSDEELMKAAFGGSR